MVERWEPLPIRRLARIYEVSDHGRIKSVDRVLRRYRIHGNDGKIGPERVHAMRIKGRLLKPYLMKIGYLRVTLGPEEEQFYLHKLIAMAFVANPRRLCEINHKDLDKTNNHWVNLEWVTHAENMAHWRKLGNREA